jgi:uncharacterized membrane protein YkoI
MPPARPPFLLAAMAVLAVACSRPAPAPEAPPAAPVVESAPAPDAAVTEESAGLLAQAAITPDSALALAKARVPGQITKAELEREDGVLLYSFDIKVAGRDGITEVHVDAATGAILAVEEEKE